jgi:hypothetical protein
MIKSHHQKYLQILFLDLLCCLLARRRKRRQIPVKIVHLLFLRVVVVEQEPEHHSRASSKDRNADIHPLNLRVDKHRDQSLVKRRAKSVGEQVDTLHERLHRRRRLGVCVLETGDGDENLSQADEDVCGCLDGDVDVVRQLGLAVHAGRACSRGVVTRACGVDKVLDNGGVGHANGREAESDADTHDRAKLDSSTAKDWVEDSVQKWSED